jgi:hypothetical protein
VQTGRSERGDRVEVVSRPERCPITLVAGVRWHASAQPASLGRAGRHRPQISHAEEGYYALLAEALQGAVPVKSRQQ